MNKNIKDIASYNQGVRAALDVIKSQFFVGNSYDNGPAIVLIESLLVPENNVYNELIIPDSVSEQWVELKNILAEM